jgi:hypothetical protein
MINRGAKTAEEEEGLNKEQQYSVKADLDEKDFPPSALAAALDRAEAKLIFERPQAKAQPHVENWDLVIDTRPRVWKVLRAKPLVPPNKMPTWRHRSKPKRQ